jgi:hypothetical protein
MKKEITYWLMSIIASVFLMDALVYFNHYEALILTILICALCAKTNRLGAKHPDYSSFLCGSIVICFFFIFILSLPALGYIESSYAKDLFNIVISASTIIMMLFVFLGLGFEELSPNHYELPKYTLDDTL